jgi:hypothetical protein
MNFPAFCSSSVVNVTGAMMNEKNIIAPKAIKIRLFDI